MDNKIDYLPYDGTSPPYEPQRKRRGCMFYGCLTAIILSIIAAIVLSVGIFLVFRAMRNFVDQFGEDAPRPIPVTELPAEDFEALQKRLLRFQEALSAQKPVEPLVLTAPQINALIDSNPQFKGIVAVDFEGDKLAGEIAFPLEKLGFPGRFINGKATFMVKVESGILIVVMESLEVKGKAVDEATMVALRQQNLAKDAADKPENAKFIGLIEKVEVKDGKLIITPKLRPEPKAGEPKPLDKSEPASTEAKPPETPETKPEPVKKAA